MAKLVYGKGVYDLPVGGYKTKGYSDWKGMLERAYSTKYHQKEPSYLDVSVHEDWLLLSNFISWTSHQRIEKGWQLDKDLLVPGNRIYSKDTCIYIPAWLNSFTNSRRRDRGGTLIGVRKREDTGKFEARCNNPITKKSQYLGVHFTEEAAYLSWKTFKLEMAYNLKSQMDDIDLRLYPGVVEIINTII